uniref:Uncharacterized protein n=1 Tax=Chromera velia CCMP2878 TaxID=1169474 RepID=A0A0G4G8B9_9ALVE|eukprot:Cvel_20675.t1-p1 / transcript=Cvel_20675.t1 / gene=Cvel_20675 / organism=Chromera_velia_CCMP2878 / gene_product=Platelet binding protein GspB, putative / transcript_product=Platelet binding protein GspB, putative / location=Cvel_scaffold1878:35648-37066(+) / protein_length=473 / sequence_SO=supercontig / SO=protein_coding / is_pseudo=false
MREEGGAPFPTSGQAGDGQTRAAGAGGSERGTAVYPNPPAPRAASLEAQPVRSAFVPGGLGVGRHGERPARPFTAGPQAESEFVGHAVALLFSVSRESPASCASWISLCRATLDRAANLQPPIPSEYVSLAFARFLDSCGRWSGQTAPLVPPPAELMVHSPTNRNTAAASTSMAPPRPSSPHASPPRPAPQISAGGVQSAGVSGSPSMWGVPVSPQGKTDSERERDRQPAETSAAPSAAPHTDAVSASSAAVPHPSLPSSVRRSARLARGHPIISSAPPAPVSSASKKRRREGDGGKETEKRRRKGSKFCEHGRQRSLCKECGGKGICEHGRVRCRCKECGGKSICEHGQERYKCKECGGGGICEHGRRRYLCKECGGGSICEHGRQRSLCKECGGKGICEHGRQRSLCKECGGGSICEHGRVRSHCKDCTSICEHGCERRRCADPECRERCRHRVHPSVCAECVHPPPPGRP